MCLLLVAHGALDTQGLTVAANRDEYYARPAEPAHWWRDRPGIVGGRDARARGSWLAASRGGRFAAVLNDARRPAPAGAPSRGELVPGFLGSADPGAFVEALSARAGRYAGFHLVAAADGWLRYCGNTGAPARRLPAGVHGFDNAGPDAPGARLKRARAAIEPVLHPQADPGVALDALADARPPGGGTGDCRPVFIAGRAFGTRCSTALQLAPTGRARLVERRFGAHGRPCGETVLTWDWSATAAAGS